MTDPGPTSTAKLQELKQLQVDVKVQASVFAEQATLTPMNDAALSSLTAMAPTASKWRFGRLVVDRGYVPWLIEALVEEGMTIGRA